MPGPVPRVAERYQFRNEVVTELSHNALRRNSRPGIITRMSSFNDEPIHVTVPGSSDDPRASPSIPGVAVRRVPALHPDDATIVDGIPVTSPARTLVDLAEVMTRDELRAAFVRAGARGLLDMAAVEAAYARVEWRPSLGILREVIDEFSGIGHLISGGLGTAQGRLALVRSARVWWSVGDGSKPKRVGQRRDERGEPLGCRVRACLWPPALRRSRA